MRVLGVIRLSRDADSSTSTAGQRSDIEAWVAASGGEHVITCWAQDTDISARKIRPVKRPQLGRYLREPGLGEWDLAVAARQDRMFRNLGDVAAVSRLCVDNGKSWYAIRERTDLESSGGRFMVNVQGAFSEMEADTIAERCQASADRLAAAGRWRGGRAPMGYAPEPLPAGGYTLAQDRVEADTARFMVTMAKDGASNGMIAAALNSSGNHSPRNGTADWSGWWSPEVVRRILRSPTLVGWSVRRGQVVRDQQTGQPVPVTSEPILSVAEWDELQQALDGRRQLNRGERVGGHQLLQVSFCRRCSAGEVGRNGHWRPVHDHAPDARCSRQCQVPLYGHHNQGRSRYGCYKCPACNYSIRKADLEGVLEQMLLMEIGDKLLPKRVVIPAISHTSEMNRIEKTLADVEGEVASGALPASSASRMLSSLETERARLSALPQRPSEVRYELTDITVRDHWRGLSSEERGRFYRSWGVKVWADRDSIQVRSGWEDPTNEGANMARAFGVSG
jgi:site-specific DNA recombinase